MVRLRDRLVASWIRGRFGKGDRERDAGLETPPDVVRFDDIRYGDGGAFEQWQLLDVYRPAGHDGADGKPRKLPVIVSVHGGAWAYGTKDVYQFYCMSLARRGFAVVNYSYRLAPECTFPAGLEDTERVFCWIERNAESFGLDTRNVFAVGDSAGGNMLALYASALTNARYRERLPFVAQKSLNLRAVALNCGKYKPDQDIEHDGQMRLVLGMLLPGHGTPEERDTVDATAHVTGQFPPAFVMTCRGDFLFSQAALMTDALRAAGVEHEYRCYGTPDEPLCHVFHCDIRRPQATACNDDECAFFMRHIQP